MVIEETGHDGHVVVDDCGGEGGGIVMNMIDIQPRLWQQTGNKWNIALK